MFGSCMTPTVPVVADMNTGNNGWGGGEGWWVLIILFALFGWGGNRGFGGGYGTGGGTFDGGIPNGFALATDFATLERKMDSIGNGVCDGFYSTANNLSNGFAAVQSALCQGFAGVNQGIVSQGYETRLGIQGLQAQAQQCCCDIQTAIQANTTQGVMNTNAIQQQIQQCCCDQEKQSMETRFQAQQNQCATLQAIDKVGDRIVDYLNSQDKQRLRDENIALRNQVDRSASEQYLINTLRPCPVPSYQTCNPWATNGTTYNTCGCYNNCNC